MTAVREVDLDREPAAPESQIRAYKIYISGPMTGYPEYNLPAFSSAHSMLTMKGLEAVNPGAPGVIPGHTWRDYMRDALKLLVECDAMCMLPGWTTSRGANIEWSIGETLGMDIRELSDWL